MAKKMGRPPKCTPERVEKICQALENGESIEMAARMAGITKPTYYDWLEKNLDFSNRVKEAKAWNPGGCPEVFENIDLWV